MSSKSTTQSKNIMLEAMKSYATTKINETKKQIHESRKPKKGIIEDLSMGDELSFGVKHHD